MKELAQYNGNRSPVWARMKLSAPPVEELQRITLRDVFHWIAGAMIAYAITLYI